MARGNTTTVNSAGELTEELEPETEAPRRALPDESDYTPASLEMRYCRWRQSTRRRKLSLVHLASLPRLA